MDALVREGAVVSEVPPGSAPTRSRFLQRNRLIAAMTRGTVVVEAAMRSGALSTARCAAALGRPVGAVPGPGHVGLVGRAATSWCARGAPCWSPMRPRWPTWSARLGADAATPAAPVRPHRSTTSTRSPCGWWTRCRSAPGRPLDRLCVASGLDPATVQAALGRLALLGLAERHAHGWRRVRSVAPLPCVAWRHAGRAGRHPRGVRPSPVGRAQPVAAHPAGLRGRRPGPVRVHGRPRVHEHRRPDPAAAALVARGADHGRAVPVDHRPPRGSGPDVLRLGDPHRSPTAQPRAAPRRAAPGPHAARRAGPAAGQ